MDLATLLAGTEERRVFGSGFFFCRSRWAGRNGDSAGFLLFNEGGAFAEAFAKVGQFGAADVAFALDFHFLNAG